jgi:hypothetical protein
VTCERGLYTVTSTRAPDPEACGCPFASPNDDARLLCVAMAGPPQAGGYPLFVLPEGGGALPSAALGVPAEVPEWRWCVRPCSSDASCPVDHTCRPAAVLGPALAEDQGVGRHTVGVCYPNRLFVGTSSVVAPPPEPDPAVCISGPGCQEQPGVSTCQYRPERTPDHPYFPAGAAWSERWSLVGRCVDRGGLTPIGRGCTDGNAQACLTGICDGGFCARVCDPAQNDDPGCLCGPAEVVRSAGEARVRDLVNLCAAR